MNKFKPYLLCLFLAGCSSAPVVNGQHGSNQAACGQEPKCASKESNLPQYSHETVTEAFDGGTKFLELVNDQHGSDQAALVQEQKDTSKKLDVPQYSHETVTEAFDGGTKFLELVSVPQE